MVNPIQFEDDDEFLQLKDDEARDLFVRIEPSYEWSSAAADDDPSLGVLVTFTPEGLPLWQERDGPAAHVILALDVSASMNRPDKFPVLRQALGDMVAKLQSLDARVILSVVTFAHGSETLFRSVPAATLDRDELVHALDHSGLLFGDYTDLAGAIGRAGRLAYDSHRLDRALPQRIYFLTDGRPQDEPRARKQMKLLHRLPVDTDVFALGADADVEMLKRLFCGARGGTVKHVRSEMLNEAWNRVAEVVGTVVAKRAVVDVELGAGVVGGGAYRFRPGRHDYGSGAFRYGRLFVADLGTLEAGRDYSLLFEVRLPATDAPTTHVATVRLRIPGCGEPVSFETKLFIPRHAGELTLRPDALVQQARYIVAAEGGDDPEAMLRALRARLEIYTRERRDPFLIGVIESAIQELETTGSLDALSRSERKALAAHTATIGSGPPRQVVPT